MKKFVFIPLIFTVSLSFGMEKSSEKQRECEQICYLNRIPTDIILEILMCLFSCDDVPLIKNLHEATVLVKPFLYSAKKYFTNDMLHKQLVKRMSKIYKTLTAEISLDLPTPASKEYLKSIGIDDVIKYCGYNIIKNGFPAQIRMLLDVWPVGCAIQITPFKNSIKRNLIIELAETDIEAQRLRLLLSKGIDVNVISNYASGDNALHKVVRTATKENEALKRKQLKVLLDYGINVDHENNNYNRTVFDLARVLAEPGNPFKECHSLRSDLERAKRDREMEKRVESHVNKWNHLK